MDYNYSDRNKLKLPKNNNSKISLGCKNYTIKNDKFNVLHYEKNIYNKEYWDKYLIWTKQNL